MKNNLSVYEFAASKCVCKTACVMIIQRNRPLLLHMDILFIYIVYYKSKNMKANEITLIKLGGSCITDKNKPYISNRDVLASLARQIKKYGNPVVIAHGTGSFGHPTAKKYGGKKGYVSKIGIAKVCHDTMRINQIVMEELIKAGLPAITLRPTALITAQAGKPDKLFFDPLLLLLRQNLVPVVHGDAIWDSRWQSTIFSSEYTLNLIIDFLLKRKLSIPYVVEVGNTNGVLDRKNKTIPSITPDNWPSLKKNIFHAPYTDVTGSMTHKIETALVRTKENVPTYIVNGCEKNILLDFLGKKRGLCTKISASSCRP